MNQTSIASTVNQVRLPIFLIGLLISGLLLLHPSVGSASQQSSGEQDAAQKTEAQKTDQQKAQKNMERVVNRAKQLRTQLKEIRVQTLKNNDELATMLDELKQTFNDSFQKNLSDGEVDVQRLKEISQKIQQGDLKEEKRKELRQEFQTLATGYQRAKVKTMRNEKIQKLNKAFSEELLAAMKKQNPDAQSMMQELKLLRAEMKATKGKPRN